MSAIVLPVVDPSGWVLCPCCGGKTRLKIAPSTEIKGLPLYCPKCKQTTFVDIKPNN